MCWVHSVFNSLQWSIINIFSSNFLRHASTCACFVSIFRSRTSFKKWMFLIYHIGVLEEVVTIQIFKVKNGRVARRFADHTL